jgi:hypothetical protein
VSSKLTPCRNASAVCQASAQYRLGLQENVNGLAEAGAIPSRHAFARDCIWRHRISRPPHLSAIFMMLPHQYLRLPDMGQGETGVGCDGAVKGLDRAWEKVNARSQPWT